uniref:Uncharacterized protein n=1 Tax=Meloidogyne incognita TaxID=6306 RepID=A0A914NK39_MELIC
MECRYMIWIWLQWKMLNLGESLELNDGFKHLPNNNKQHQQNVAISNSIGNSIAGPIIKYGTDQTSNSLPDTSFPPPNLLVEVSRPHSSPSSNPDSATNCMIHRHKL